MLYEISEKTMKLESEGKRIIKFNLGDPDQQTPPEIVEAAVLAMKEGKTKYASSVGERRLREELARIHEVTPENVVVTTGSKWAIYSIMSLLLNQGDNVVIPTPYWTAYGLTAKNFGVGIKLLKTDVDSNWKINVEEFKELIDQRTRLLILNNPTNPTSKVIDGKVFTEIVEIANNAGITVLSDEVYSDISFVKTKSILSFGNQNILVHSFSKTFAMTGWRVGYAVVARELAERMMKLNQITLTNVPVFIQHAALKALDLKEKIVTRIREEYKRRADLACSIISKVMRFSRPDAPFYLFPKYDNLDSESFALRLLDKGVAVAPGTAFGDYREHIRIALTVPEAEIKVGLNKICEALE